MDIYYTPSLEVNDYHAQKSYSGDPAFLAEWMNGIAEPNDFLILGSNGVVYDQGTAILEEGYVAEAETVIIDVAAKPWIRVFGPDSPRADLARRAVDRRPGFDLRDPVFQ